MKKLIFFLLPCIVFISCAGYQFQEKKNPLKRYQISSIKVPMFYNHSNFSNIEAPFTSEVVKVLLPFKDLKLVSNKGNSDAVLLGIVKSNWKKTESKVVTSSKSVLNTYGDDSLGERGEDFNAPISNKLILSLRVILIKHPTKKELEFFRENSEKQFISSKIIFNKLFRVEEAYTLKELSGEGLNTLETQNRAVERETLLSLAKKAASSFEDMILYVF